MAFHHPTRRWLAELLEIEGPASVGRLAARTGLAVGSVSHHLKALHRHGFIEPAPDLARDTRESWWRSVRRPLSWSADEFEAGSAARRVADAAEAENFRHQVRAVGQWLGHMHEVSVVAAGRELHRHGRPGDARAARGARRATSPVAEEWSRECLDDQDESRRGRLPVRLVLRAFPSGPVPP